MAYLKFFKDISKSGVAEAGGKGASLGELTKAGIPVPPGFVVLASAFDRFLEETKLNIEIAARLKEVNPEDTNSIERASVVIRDVIHDRAMPRALELEILSAFDELARPLPTLSSAEERGRDDSFSPQQRREREERSGSFFVAVRSSATAEDSAVASWAGELETYLNTTRETLVERVKQCWSSLFTPRAIFYRHEKNLIDHYVSVAVVIQKMVQSDISGIAFTVHPVTGDYDQMIIEAGLGLGEAIVGGQITPDSYVVSKEEMRILDINVSTQMRKLVKKLGNKEIKKQGNSVRNNNGAMGQLNNPLSEEDNANQWVEMSESEGSKQKLSGEQIIEAAELFKKIEEHYGFPCDIEWALENGKFYITQSRPITTLKPSTTAQHGNSTTHE
jgi:pyruvate,water dikinase